MSERVSEGVSEQAVCDVCVSKMYIMTAAIGRSFSPTEIYTALGIIAIPVFYIVGAGSTIFWIIGMFVVMATVMSHDL